MNTEEKLKFLRSHPHVVAIGDGERTTRGKKTGEKCTVYSVPKKVPIHMLSADMLLPPDGDVVETGVIRALYPSAPGPKPRGVTKDVYTDRVRPAPGGVSVGHEKISAGTLGCWVNYKGRKVMLSNNHVLANSNDAKLGDVILQPGPHDGGSNPQDEIGYLTDFVKIHFLGEGSDCPLSKAVAFSLNTLWKIPIPRRKKWGGWEFRGCETQFQAIVPHADSNLVDAAIADVLNESDIKDEILNIGKIYGTIEDAFISMPIQKTGRTTGFTTGEIIQTDVVVQIQYGFNQIAVFQGQLMAGPMSAGGDSGSLVVSGDKAVGLLFAGSDNTTIFSPIKYVMDELNINF